MKRTEYFLSEKALNEYYPDGVPSNVLAIVKNDDNGVLMFTSSNNDTTITGESAEFGGYPEDYSYATTLSNYTLEGVPLTKVEFDARTLYNIKIAFNEMTLNNDYYETSCAGGNKAIAIDETFENGDKKYYWFGGDTIMNAYNTPYQGVETEYNPMSGGSVNYMTTCTLNGKFLWDSSNKTLTITYA